MTREELSKWLTDHGGESGRKRISPETEDNPDYSVLDKDSLPKRRVKNPWVQITAGDGSTLVLRNGASEDTWEVRDYQTAPTARAGAATPTTTSTRYEWREVDTPNGKSRRLHIITSDATGKVLGDDEATPAQQQEYEQFEKGGSKKTYGAAYKNAAGTWVRPWQDAQGQTGVEPLPPAAVPSEADKNKYTQIKQDETTGKWSGLTSAGTWEPIAGGPGGKPSEPPKERVNPADPTRRQVWDSARNGGLGDWVDSGAIRQPVEPPGAPKISNEPGQTASSLFAYSEWLNQQLAAGTIDGATATALMTRRRAEAETFISERSAAETRAGGLLGADVTQRGQDTATVGQRLSASSTGYSSALTAALALNAKQGKRTDAGYRAFLDLLNQNVAHADRFGGRVDIPRAGIPSYLQPYAATGVGPSPTAGYPGAPAPPAPAVAPAAAVPPPAAAGQVPGATGAPGTPVGPFPAPAAQPATVPPAEPGTVPLAPGGASPAAAWTLPAGQGSLAAIGALGGLAGGGQSQLGAYAAGPQPGGNAFAETEMQLTRQGFSPEIIAEARRRFLAQMAGGVAA